MGNSNKQKKIKDQNIESYFNLIKKINRKRYLMNDKKIDNLNFCFNQKNFDSIQINNKNNNIHYKFIHWLDYLYECLFKYQQNEIIWAEELINLLEKEYFLNENKYLSLFFYQEFSINFEPKIIKNCDLNKKKEYSLNESLISFNSTILNINDSIIEYKFLRTKIKEYLIIFKSHILNDDHPIKIIINNFEIVWVRNIKEKIQKIQEIKIYKNEDYEKITNFYYEKSTEQLQNFIINLHICLKLFYSKTIDFSCFNEEKDELINLITTLIFQSGNIYKVMYDLYYLKLKNDMEKLQNKLNLLNEINPENLGIKIQFCLNNSTFNYQKNLLIQFLENKQNNNNNNNNNNNLIKKANNLLKNIQEKINNISENPSQIYDSKTNFDDNEIYNFPNYNSKTLEKYNEIIFFEENNNEINTNSYLNTTINNNINNESIISNFFNKSNLKKKNINNNFNFPYFSCIKLLKSLNIYKSPFEKINIIANLSNEITDNINFYWEDFINFINPNLLQIDAEQLINIFIFILIKSQMKEILIHCYFIKNFITTLTKSTLTGFYFSNIEASISYILNIKNIQELIKDESFYNLKEKDDKKI